jgi:putative flippase GtrA
MYTFSILFSRHKEILLYALIGCLNSIVHILVFYVLNIKFGVSQGTANLAAFYLSVTLSYILNGKVTFKNSLSINKYFCFVLLLGSNAFLFGYLGGVFKIHPMIMVTCFATLNLVLSFLGSKFWVFK